MFFLVLIDAICFTPSKNPSSDPKQCSFFCFNTSLEPIRKAGSERFVFLKFLNAHREKTLDIQNPPIIWWGVSLWRCLGGFKHRSSKGVTGCLLGNTHLPVMVNWWILVVWVGIARLPNHHTQTIIFFAICSNLRTTKLPYIKGLGCRGIWISPIFQCLGGGRFVAGGGRQGVVSSWCFFAGWRKLATIVIQLSDTFLLHFLSEIAQWGTGTFSLLGGSKPKHTLSGPGNMYMYSESSSLGGVVSNKFSTFTATWRNNPIWLKIFQTGWNPPTSWMTLWCWIFQLPDSIGCLVPFWLIAAYPIHIHFTIQICSGFHRNL